MLFNLVFKNVNVFCMLNAVAGCTFISYKVNGKFLAEMELSQGLFSDYQKRHSLFIELPNTFFFVAILFMH